MRMTIAVLPCRVWYLPLVLYLALGVVGLVAAAPPDCDSLGQRGFTAYQQKDRDYLEGLLQHAAACPDQGFLLAIWNAGLWWNVALSLHEDGAPQETQEAALNRVLDFAPLWQAHAALGDVASARDDHVEATRHYQAALDSINSPALTPNEPPEAVIREIFRKAQASRLLAPVYVATSRSRSGAPTGLASTAFRSFSVREIAVPIQYHFDSVEFTEKGLDAAADLLDYLNRQDVAAVTLIGHADPVGDVEYNRKLSLRRAQALGDYLQAAGYHGSVQIDGRGSEEPFAVDDPSRYTQAQLHQLHRRVELRRD